MTKRFTGEQIIGILKEDEAGMKVAELCRKHEISDATYYNWKSKFGEMSVSEARRQIKRLEQALGRKTLENEILDKRRWILPRQKSGLRARQRYPRTDSRGGL
jgi:putative transposase